MKRLGVVSILISLAVSGCFDPYAAQRRESGERARNGEEFIQAVAEGNEATATAYLSSSAKAEIQTYCEGGLVISCFEALKLSNRTIQHMAFDFGIPVDSRYAYGYTVLTGTNVLWVVLDFVEENNRWVISGWRGGDSRGMDENELSLILDGRNPLNQFPPSENENP